MGYYMSQVDQDFKILAENKQAAFELLKQWEQKEIARHPELDTDYNRPLRNAAILEDALSELYWSTHCDEKGNITGLYFTGEKLLDEAKWMDAMAPAVKEGSKLMMCGEEGSHWCWYFDGENCIDYPGEVIYPDMPED